MAPFNGELRNAESILFCQPQDFRVENNTVEFLLFKKRPDGRPGKHFETALGIPIIYPQIGVLDEGINSGGNFTKNILVLGNFRTFYGPGCNGDIMTFFN